MKFEKFVTQISLRDLENEKKYIGSIDNWNKAEQSIINAAKDKGLNSISTEILYEAKAHYAR